MKDTKLITLILVLLTFKVIDLSSMSVLDLAIVALLLAHLVQTIKSNYFSG